MPDVELSNLDKALFPGDGVGKGDVIEHYRMVCRGAVAPHRRPSADAAAVPGRDRRRRFLVYLANLSTIEHHIWPSTLRSLDRPDRLVVDIDPPDGTDAATLRAVARDLRDLFESMGLTPYVQATGGRGFHVVAPLDGSEDYDFVRPLAADLADHLAAGQPNLLTTAQRKQRRRDRIFLDVNRNAYGQTFIAPYSLRARRGAPVATPLDWSELGRSTPNGYDAKKVRRRLARKDDPWATMGIHAASAARARRELDTLRS